MRLGSVLLPTQVLRRRRGYRTLKLLRPDVQRALGRYGYVVLSEGLHDRAVERLVALHAEVAAAEPPDAERFTPLNLWRAPNLDPATRADLLERMEAEVSPALGAITLEGAAVSATVFQSKPPSPTSGVDVHQDAILVDERRDFGAYAWIPLTDVDERNGALYIVPGSHRYAQWPRLPSTGNELEHLRSAILREASLLRVAAGQIVLFDQATWHGSLPNCSGERRVAVGAVIRPRARASYLAERGPSTPERHLELYRYPSEPDRRSARDLTDRREHVGQLRCAQMKASPRSFALTCALERAIRPGAPGVRLEPWSSPGG
ncbi:MAG: phytanoyl-CoA dioxygenase family protein [Acidimicrobiales bacterium]|nr:phytanoyl-CoA dioxygenase family protein [Acidimicrobiales bacterium]